eukprot:TRINITY_DN14634_c0_g1_i2.p4 TRINITY_DN14634_c0_g1~~TRINITY_DN14634_c0_g1_i2.p4  ORF type:complete len:103 (-),score=8.75 TRINITY_DN14634_c0_g1_i2:447-755(-)
MSTLLTIRMTMRASPMVRYNCAMLTRAGEKFRKAHGISRSGNADGPIHDLPDFHFVDGRVPEETAKEKKWKKIRTGTAETIVRLQDEVDDFRDAGHKRYSRV